MARSSAEERWGGCDFEQDHVQVEEEEEEALSLSDLPLNQSKEENCDDHTLYEKPRAIETKEDEFDFNYWRIPKSTQNQPQMCLADEVFCKGQILPVRVSVSSDSTIHNSTVKLKSISSRSSSSNNSTPTNSRPKIPNLFHFYPPTPKPQIKISPSPPPNQTSIRYAKNPIHKSSTWDFFRVGLVRTPGTNSEIRAFVGINGRPRGRARVELEKKSGILSGVGCKCSVESLPSRIVIKSNSSTKSSNDGRGRTEKEIREHELVELKKMKMKKLKQMEQQGKMAFARGRTLKWLKELSQSHVSVPDDATL